jgi:hypothetical protein
MGRTIPSFRIALAMEKEEWKAFRNALDKSDRKKLDEVFDIPRLYTSACSYAVQPVRLYPILMSILLYHYKLLTQCIKEVEWIETKLPSDGSCSISDAQRLMKEVKKEEEQQDLQPSSRPRPQLKLIEF